MKFKWQFWAGCAFAGAILLYGILAYIFMWAPVVVYRNNRDADPCVNNLHQMDAAINQF
jgi:hypothetical protein